MDKDEFDRMKSEAEQRMKEIYAGSQQEPQGKSEDTEYKPSMSPQKQENTGSGIINTLFKDKDKTVILALLLLLMDDRDGKTDYSLLLALIYILLD